MSEETTTGAPPPRNRDMTAPVVHDRDLAEFLESLFYSHPEPEQYPERIDLNIVSMSPRAEVRDTIWTKQFAPIKATREEIKKGAGAAKPSKEELVALSNFLLGKMKHHCKEFGQTRMYSVDAISTSRGPDAYMRFPKKMVPAGRSNTPNGELEETEDGEPLSREQRFMLKLYKQNQEMHQWFGDLVANFIDRYNRDKERDSDEIHKLHKEISSKNDQLERALSLELDREERRDGLKMRRNLVEKGFQVLEQFGPPLVMAMLGTKGQQVIDATTVDVPEVLRTFLRNAAEDQLEKAMGDWVEGKCIRAGVLSPDQSLLIVNVANGSIKPTDLEKLKPPAGALQVKPEQLMALAGIFDAEQLRPLRDLFVNSTNQGAK